MSYSYEWQYKAKLEGKTTDMANTIEEADPMVREDAIKGIRDEALNVFTKEFAKEGRTLRVDNIDIALENFQLLQGPRYRKGFPPVTYNIFYVKTDVTMTVLFTTDIAPDEKHSIAFAIAEVLLAIAAAIYAHKFIFALIAFVLVWFAVSVGYRLTGTSAYTPLTPTGVGEWLTMIAVIIVLLALLGLLPTILSLFKGWKKGKKAKKHDY